MFTTRSLVKIIFNTILGIVLIFIWLKFVDIGQIWETLSRVKLISILPITVFLFLSLAFRAARLKIFLSPIKKIALQDLVFLNGAATMLNFLIPIRGGEVLKGVFLNNQYDIPFGKSLVWIFLDRFMDFMAVLVIASILLFIIPTSLNINIIKIIIIIFTIAILCTYLIVYQANLFRNLVKLLSHLLIVNSIKIYFERICNFFIESFEIFRRKPLELLLLFFVTLLGYAADAGVWFFTFLSLGQPQPFIKMYLAQNLSALTYLIPAAPGYIGSAEASGLLILSGVFGIDRNLASAMIVLFHVITTIFVISFGIVSIYFLKIDLKGVLKKVLRRS